MTENIWTGKLVRLRAVEPSDWDFFRSLDLDSEVARLGYNVPFPLSVEGQKKWAAEQAAARPDRDNFRWVVETLEGTPVGTITTHGCHPEDGYFEYGISIAREHWSHGYASEAITILMRFMFTERRYQTAGAIVFAYNERSKALHEKLGFVLEGRWRRVHYAAGEYHEAFIFGMTKEEFAERYG